MADRQTVWKGSPPVNGLVCHERIRHEHKTLLVLWFDWMSQAKWDKLAFSYNIMRDKLQMADSKA